MTTTKSDTKRRPVHLNLLLIWFPVPAVMSIGHRVSGVVWVLSIPVLLYLLQLSLSSPQGFAQAQALLAGRPAQLVVLLFVWALAHHFLAGLRYLALDLDLGVDKAAARLTAWGVMLGAPLLALLVTLGVYA